MAGVHNLYSPKGCILDL